MLGWGFFSPTSTSVTSHYTYRHIANVHVDPFESVHPLSGTVQHRGIASPQVGTTGPAPASTDKTMYNLIVPNTGRAV